MNINWKVRIKNPVFWCNIAIAILLPILAYMSLSWSDITSWSILGKILFNAIQNPVIIVAVIVSAWNAVNDPTTKGLSDSIKALTYKKPNTK